MVHCWFPTSRMARSIASPMKARSNVWMQLISSFRRPLILGLAAAGFFGVCSVAAQNAPTDKLQLCGACHGEDGNSKMEKIPSLAGQPAFFIFNQLFLMREGVRKVEAMAPIVKDLKDEDLDALSKHFSALPPKKSDEEVDQALSKRGEEIATAR